MEITQRSDYRVSEEELRQDQFLHHQSMRNTGVHKPVADRMEAGPLIEAEGMHLSRQGYAGKVFPCRQVQQPLKNSESDTATAPITKNRHSAYFPFRLHARCADCLTGIIPSKHLGTEWIETIPLQFLRHTLLDPEDCFADRPNGRLGFHPVDKFDPQFNAISRHGCSL